MNLVWHNSATPITHTPVGGNPFTFTPLAAAKDQQAWERCLGWLILKSARFRAIMADFAAYDKVENAYVVFSEDLEIGGGKFFTVEETNSVGWGNLKGQPVVVIKPKVCPIISFDIQGDSHSRQFDNYVGTYNVDLFGHSRASDMDRNPFPTGWSVEGVRKKSQERLQCIRSPLILVAHELGHLWQWITWKNGYNAVMAAHEKTTGSRQRNLQLRIEINNIVNNEAPIAFELGESVRFNYNTLSYKSFDFAYTLPEPSEDNVLPMLFSGDTRDWPSSNVQVREYGSCQMSNVSYNASSSPLIELSNDFLPQLG